MEKLNIESKINNGARQKLIEEGLIASEETVSNDEFNALVGKTNELVEAFNFGTPITAFNFLENVPTYEDLPLTGNQVNDGYGVLEDGLIYVWNGSAFPAKGNGIDLGLKAKGKVKEGEKMAVSGAEVYRNLQNFTENKEFDYAIVDKDSKILFGVRKNGSIYPEQDQDLDSKLNKLNNRIDSKVDTEEGKVLVKKDVESQFSVISNDEFIYAIVDKEGKILQAFRKDGTQVTNSESDEKKGIYFNNLKNQESIASFDFSDYGKNTAKYKLKVSRNSHISIKGRFVHDVNNENKRVPLIKFLTRNSVTNSLDLVKGLPIQGKERELYRPEFFNVPMAHLKSGFAVDNEVKLYENIINRDNEGKIGFMDGILGDQMLIVWYKGKVIVDKVNGITEVTNTPPFSNNYFSEEWARDRSNSFIHDHENLYIEIANDVFKVGRDNEGIVFQTSLKNSTGNYKNLKSFYEELVPPTAGDFPPKPSINALSDFYINFVNMDTNKTTESIFQCGKIYLISYLRQGIDPDNLGEGKYEYAYECYPFFVHNKVSKKEHVFDILTDESSSKIFINGLLYKSIPVSEYIDIGNEHMLFKDLEINHNGWGECEIIKGRYLTSLASKRTPVCFGIMSHNLYDTYEGSTHKLQNMALSVTKLYRILDDAKAKGYKFINFREWADWQAGNSTIPIKSILLVTDDNQIPMWWLDNQRLRTIYEKKGAKVNFAQIIEDLLNTPKVTPQTITNLQLIGHGVANHTRWHNNEPSYKTTHTFLIELMESKIVMAEYGMCEQVYIYNKSGGDYAPLHGMLDYFGYVGAVGLSRVVDEYGKLHQNRFSFTRMDIGTNQEINLQ